MDLFHNIKRLSDNCHPELVSGSIVRYDILKTRDSEINSE